jgi:hypothetical protein
MLYPKLQYAAQGIFMNPGQQGPSWEDPFPLDQLWPDWMREKGIGPIAGQSGNYTLLQPSVSPPLDLATSFGGVPQMLGNGFSAQGMSGVTGMLTPAFKIPAEVASGVSLQNLAPIKDWGQYFTSQIPGVSDVSRTTNLNLAGTNPDFATQGFGNTQNIINYLTGAGLTQTTPKTNKGGQIDYKNYLKSLKGQ